MGISARKMRQVSGNLVIVFAMLWVLTAFLFFVFFTAQKSIEAKLEATKAEKQKTEEEERSLSQRFTAVQGMVGFYELAQVRENLKEMSEVQVKAEDVVANLNALNLKDPKGETPGSRNYYGIVQLPDAPKIEESMMANLKNYDAPVNLEKALAAFQARIYDYQRNKMLLEREMVALDLDIESKKAERARLDAWFSNIKADLEKEKDRLDKKYENQLTALRDVTQKAQETKENADKESEKIEKDIERQKMQFEDTIQQKSREILQLQTEKYGKTAYAEIAKQKVYDPSEDTQDGAIVLSDPTSEKVYIDIGKDAKILPGFKFDVYRFATKGDIVSVGRIEVQRVMDKMSLAAVLEQNRLNPIVAGDVLINPVYHPKSSIHFVFTGNFKISKITNEKAKKLIEEMGGVVEDKITAKTHYVVVGKEKGEEDPLYAEATRFRIMLISEETLLRYIGD